MTKIIEAIVCIMLIVFFLWRLSPTLKKDIKASLSNGQDDTKDKDGHDNSADLLAVIVKQFARHLYKEQYGTCLKDSKENELEVGDFLSYTADDRRQTGVLSLNVNENNLLVESEPYAIINEDNNTVSINDVTNINVMKRT